MIGNSATFQCFLLSSLLLIAGGGRAWADMPVFGVSPWLMAGIELPADASPKKKVSKAAENKSKAKLYQEAETGKAPVLEEVEEEEGGVLGVRKAPESASENRTRARLYQQGTTPAPLTVPKPNEPTAPEASTRENARENLSKARAYASKSKTSNSFVVEKIGSDGIPIVTCAKATDNVAGRIGEDAEPGGIFYVMRDNKPFKVRCSSQ